MLRCSDVVQIHAPLPLGEGGAVELYHIISYHIVSYHYLPVSPQEELRVSTSRCTNQRLYSRMDTIHQRQGNQWEKIVTVTIYIYIYIAFTSENKRYCYTTSILPYWSTYFSMDFSLEDRETIQMWFNSTHQHIYELTTERQKKEFTYGQWQCEILNMRAIPQSWSYIAQSPFHFVVSSLQASQVLNTDKRHSYPHTMGP